MTGPVPDFSEGHGGPAPSANAAEPGPGAPSSRGVLAAAAVLLLVGTAAYFNSQGGVFLYDDLRSIRDNEHIRQLWPLSEAMSLPLVQAARRWPDGRC